MWLIIPAAIIKNDTENKNMNSIFSSLSLNLKLTGMLIVRALCSLWRFYVY